MINRILYFVYTPMEKILTHFGIGPEINAVSQVAEYLGLEPKEVIRRARIKDTSEESELWNYLNASTKAGYRSYYAQNIHYLERQDWYNRHKRVSWVKYIPRSGNYLDYGCGTGFVASRVHKSRPDINIHLADIPEAMTVEFAKYRFDSQNAKYTWHSIPSDEYVDFIEKFDFIRCCDVLEHTFHPDRVMENFYLSLKPGGTILFDFLLDPLADKENTVQAQELRSKTLAFVHDNFIIIKQKRAQYLVQKPN